MIDRTPADFDGKSLPPLPFLLPPRPSTPRCSCGSYMSVIALSLFVALKGLVNLAVRYPPFLPLNPPTPVARVAVTCRLSLSTWRSAFLQLYLYVSLLSLAPHLSEPFCRVNLE